MSLIIVEPDIYIAPNAQAVVSTSSPGAAPSFVIDKNDEAGGISEIIPWGVANDFPQKVLKDGERSTIIPTALKWQANLISKTVLPFLVDYDDNGKEVVQLCRDPEIMQFLDSRFFRRYQRESANDIFWFLNVFPEIILSKDRKKITHIHPNEAAHCRWSAQNSKGQCEFVYMNANWPDANVGDKETIKIRALDPYHYDLVNWTRETHTNIFKFIFPASYPTPGKTFYQLAHWNGIRRSGWLDVLASVPKLKKALFENQMTIKYHIQIPERFWEQEFGSDWKKWTTEERNNAKMQVANRINRNLVGSEKSGVAMMSEFGISAIDGKTVEGWKIEAIPDKLKDGQYLADNMEATAHLLYALGLDPTLVGFASKEMGSRSGGSDKRESLLIYLSQLEPYRDILFEPLDFIAEYNGWKAKYPQLKFRIPQTLLTTLDTGASSKEVPA